MRVLGVALAMAAMAGLSATAVAQPPAPDALHALQAKKKAKRCKAGYVRKTVKVKRHRKVHGRRRTVTVRVKRCVKAKKKQHQTVTGPAPAPITQAPATSFDERACPQTISSFTHPIPIGTVTRTVVLRGCLPLTSGVPFNVRYFSFTLTQTAPAQSAVAALFTTTADAASAVHPRLATTSGGTLLTSASNGFWIGNPVVGRGIPIGGLPPGTYMLGMEKLSSPLGSLNTPPFDAVVLLG